MTAVQLRNDSDLEARLVFGDPVEERSGTKGIIKLFSVGQLVGYEVRTAIHHQLFIFRTVLPIDLPLLSNVPGVHPAVQLLLVTKTKGARIKALRACRWATAEGRIQTASDAFWLRLAAIVAGRAKCTRSVVHDLLGREATHP